MFDRKIIPRRMVNTSRGASLKAEQETQVKRSSFSRLFLIWGKAVTRRGNINKSELFICCTKED